MNEIPKLTISSPPTRHYRLSDMVRNAANRQNTRVASFQQPPTRHSDFKQGETTTSVTAMHALSGNKDLPAISGPEPGQSARGVGGLPVQGQLFPPMRPQPPPTVLDMRAFAAPPAEQTKRPKKKKTKQAGRPTISGPILRDDGSNPLERIATLDLDTAARAEEERRAAHPQPLESHSIGTRGPVAMSSEELLQRSKSVGERKAVGQIPTIKTSLEPIIESGGASKTSSAQFSPGVENMRQRSPRQSQQQFTRQTPPPLPPLKTPGTVKSLAVPSPAQQDAWDLLAVPKNDNSKDTSSETSSQAPEPPLRSPLREQPPPERPSTSPAAKSIATMTQTSQPDNTGRHRRSQSVSSRRSRPRDKMFTDARTPPPIPEKCMNRKSFLQTQSLYVDAPPPYNFNGQSFTSPQRVAANMATVETAQSPTLKPENKLSLFPASYLKGSIGSPKHKAEAAVKAALAVKTITAPVALPIMAELPGCAVPPHPRNRSHTTGNIPGRGAPQAQSPIRRTTLITPIDKPLPASPSIPNMVRESVLNRPRPITRTPETGRFLTSYNHQPREHRRSASCGSIRTKKSIVHNETLGSPSALPPLPPVPTERSPVLQGSVGDTRSMTVEEKMDLLSPKSGELRRKRRSMSMPEMPELSHVALPVASFLEEEGLTRTARSTMSSVRTQSILNMADSERPNNSRSTTKSTIDTVPSVPALPALPDDVVPIRGVTSPQHRINAEETKQVPPYPDSPMSPRLAQDAATVSGSQDRSSCSNEANEETSYFGAPSSKDSWELDSVDFDSVQGEDAFSVVQLTKQKPSIPKEVSTSKHKPSAGSVDNSYHNRLGSCLPSFSSREHPIQGSRRGPPPHPLLLNRPPKTLLIEAEPSPLDSPEQALDILEEQLQKLERSSRTSSVTREQRMTLLADLETEMGLQEKSWQNLRHTIVRDSLSTVTTSPQQVAQLPSLWAKVLESRGSRLLADPTRSDALGEAASRKSHLSQAGSRMSLLTVSRPTTAQLGSPTPPDTDEDAEIPVMLDEVVNMLRKSQPCLWRVEVPSPTILKQEASLWSPSASASFVLPNATLQAALPARPSNKASQDLLIESRQLWTPKSNPKRPQSSGLWHLPVPSIPFDTPEEPDTPEATTPKTRPLTIRPPRKIKRMTALPDILESPKPLSTRHNTLGIFQFPWGEKSHTGAIPLPIFGAMPGTMTSGRGPGHVAPDPVFSKRAQDEGSFFDDCDEEDVGDNFSDFDDEDDGDDFDETTLWEIASLLKSDKLTTQTRVVSGEWLNNSNRRTSVIASPTESMDSPQCTTIPLVLDVEPASKPAVPVKQEKKALWQRKSQFYTVEKSLGLRQPNRSSWQKYLGAVDERRQRKGSRDEVATVDGDGLWAIQVPVERAASGTLLWSPRAADQSFAVQQTQAQPLLWKAAPAPRLADPRHLWAVQPAEPPRPLSPKPLTGLAMRPIARKAAQDLPLTPSATSLWFGDKEPVTSPNWISASRIRLTEEPLDLLKTNDTIRSDSKALWSHSAPRPAPKPRSGIWQPPSSLPASPSQESPKLQPRYSRKSSLPIPTPEVKDIRKQSLWKRPLSSASKDAGSNWLSKSKKHRTFQEDVETVQDYLNKRWGGM